jgi:1-acyl-sn-glycerol-3-phosphate acyltransferase
MNLTNEKFNLNQISNFNNYQTPEIKIPYLNRIFPGMVFYSKLFSIVLRASKLAKQNKYLDDEWVKSSLEVLTALESVGIKISVENIDAIKNIDKPCVFIGNHMSTLETFVLPCLIKPLCDMTFIVKKELIEYPIFGHVMRSRNPIIVGRKDPRQDFKTVLEEGKKRLDKGTSIVVFPQTTRTTKFDPNQFNTIGIKLAKFAKAPIIPIALKTDAWGNGKKFKDLGKINPSKKVYFRFGNPIYIEGNGKKEHEEITKFITEFLASHNPIG